MNEQEKNKELLKCLDTVHSILSTWDECTKANKYGNILDYITNIKNKTLNT